MHLSGVEGFFTKYFEGKKWGDEAQNILNNLEGRYSGGATTIFPNQPVESAAWNWLSSIQDGFFNNTCGMYFTTKRTADLTGSEAKRQFDLLLESRSCPEKKKHDWKDVLAVGEHQLSNKDWKTGFFQLRQRHILRAANPSFFSRVHSPRDQYGIVGVRQLWCVQFGFL